MTAAPAPSAPARPGPSMRWMGAGAAATAVAGTALLAWWMPAGTMLDYPAVDTVLRSAARAPGPMATVGVAALVAGLVAAIRCGRGIEFASGAAASAWLALAVAGWIRLEARESDIERAELAAVQSMALRPVAVAMGDALVALEELGAPPAAGDDAPWWAAARRLVERAPEARALAWMPADGSAAEAIGPEKAQVAAIAQAAAGAVRTDRAWAAAVDLAADGSIRAETRLALGLPAAGGGCALLVLNAAGVAGAAQAPESLGVAIGIGLAHPGDDDAPDPVEPSGAAPGLRGMQPPFALRTAGLAWSARAYPAPERLDARHQRGNTTLLSFGWLGAIGCAAAGVALRRSSDARRDAEVAERRLAAATARARIAALGREALSAEAGHVLRARIRETLRTLESAAAPGVSASVRDDALARAADSLSMAEDEVGALLDRPGHTRVERAEGDAALDHLYAQTVLEFPGGVTADVAQPVAPGALAEVQRRLGSATFAVISSDNPMSIDLGPRANQLRRGVLALELRSAGHAHVPATGRSRDGGWSEQGFAVAVGPHDADAIAELHEQRAYFWFDGERLWIHEVTGARRTIALPRASA